MKKCDIFKVLISVYLDNEAKEDEKEKLKVHLNECEECNKEFKELKITKDFFNFYEKNKPSVYFTERVLNSIKKEKRMNIFRIGFAFAVFAILITGIYLRRAKKVLYNSTGGDIISYLLDYQDDSINEEILSIYYGRI